MTYNGFTKWLHCGNAGWLTSHAPELQEKGIKFLDLVVASTAFSTTIDMTRTLRQVSRDGWTLKCERSGGSQLLTAARTTSALLTTPPTSSCTPPAYNPTLHAAPKGPVRSQQRDGDEVADSREPSRHMKVACTNSNHRYPRIPHHLMGLRGLGKGYVRSP
ncbi:Tn3 family transposase [Streptomyces sp. NPDC055709]